MVAGMPIIVIKTRFD